MLTDTKGQASAEEIKKAIDEKQKASGAKPPEPPAPAPPQSVRPEAPKQTQAPKEPSKEVPPPEDKPKGQGDDALEWASKKGLKTPEDMANSLRNLEREFHKRNQPTKEELQPKSEPQPPVAQPPYQPPVYPQHPSGMLEHYANQYGMHPEDFKKVLRISQDIADARIAEIQQKFGQELGNLKRSTAKNDDLMNVMRNPNSRHPQVQREMHQILEKNPDLFKRDDAYSQALNQALINIASRNLQGSGGSPQNSTQGLPPSTPPPSGGSGSGSGGKAPALIPMTEEAFAKLSADEQAKHLKKLGVMKTY